MHRCQNGPIFSGVYLKTNLPKVKNGSTVIKIDEYGSFETHWLSVILEMMAEYIFMVLVLYIF